MTKDIRKILKCEEKYFPIHVHGSRLCRSTAANTPYAGNIVDPILAWTMAKPSSLVC